MDLSKVKIIIILIIVGCLILGGLVPSINSILINNNNEALKDDYNKKHEDEYKKTGIDDDVRAYASFYWKPQYPDPGEKITFYSSSHAYNGIITSEKWSFEGGDSANGRRATQTYEKKGRYKVTLSVSAIGSGFDRNTRTSYVDVGGDPFPKIICTPENPSPGEQVILDATESSDPDGTIISYKWSYYDINDPENIINLGSDVVIYHAWEKQGTYIVMLFTEDNKGNNNTLEKAIDVSILKLNGFDTLSRGLKFKIRNSGNITAFDVKWNVEIYKIKILGIESKTFYKNSNTISQLNSGDSQTIKLRDIRRKICKIKLVVTAEADNAVKISKTFYGRIIGKFIYLTEKNIIRPLVEVSNLFTLTWAGFFFLFFFIMAFNPIRLF